MTFMHCEGHEKNVTKRTVVVSLAARARENTITFWVISELATIPFTIWCGCQPLRSEYLRMPKAIRHLQVSDLYTTTWAALSINMLGDNQNVLLPIFFLIFWWGRISALPQWKGLNRNGALTPLTVPLRLWSKAFCQPLNSRRLERAKPQSEHLVTTAGRMEVIVALKYWKMRMMMFYCHLKTCSVVHSNRPYNLKNFQVGLFH